MTIFEAYVKNSPRFSELSLIFHISLPRMGCFFVEKRKPKIIFALKNVMEGEIRKILTFVIR